MNKKAQGSMEGTPPSLLRGRLPSAARRNEAEKPGMHTGKREGAGRRQEKRLLLKEMRGGPMPGTLEKGESVAPKGRGTHGRREKREGTFCEPCEKA